MGYPGLDLHAKRAKVLSDHTRRPELTVPQLRVLMQVSAPIHHSLGYGLREDVDLRPESLHRVLGRQGTVRRKKGEDEDAREAQGATGHSTLRGRQSVGTRLRRWKFTGGLQAR
jgi:hypothetical protein